MHKKIKRNLKFLLFFVLIGFILCYIIEINEWLMLDFEEMIFLLIVATVVLMTILFFDTGISVIKEESGDNSLDNNDCFYAKSVTKTKNSKVQKAKNNSIWKSVLKYVFYTILAVIGAIVLLVLILISILSQLPPGTDM